MNSIYSKAMALLHKKKEPKARRYERAKEKVYDIDQDVHTRHCCKYHGCKYGEDEWCTVVTTDHPGMTGGCQSCFEDGFIFN